MEGRAEELPLAFLGRITVAHDQLSLEEIDALEKEAFRFSGVGKLKRQVVRLLPVPARAPARPPNTIILVGGRAGARAGTGSTQADATKTRSQRSVRIGA